MLSERISERSRKESRNALWSVYPGAKYLPHAGWRGLTTLSICPTQCYFTSKSSQERSFSLSRAVKRGGGQVDFGGTNQGNHEFFADSNPILNTNTNHQKQTPKKFSSQKILSFADTNPIPNTQNQKPKTNLWQQRPLLHVCTTSRNTVITTTTTRVYDGKKRPSVSGNIDHYYTCVRRQETNYNSNEVSALRLQQK